MARLGDFIREECHPLGASGAKALRLIGVSNDHGLHASSRDTSDDLSRYQRIERDWFAYNPMRVNVGSIGLADDDTKTGFTSPDYVIFSCRAGLDPHYLLHFLKSDYGLEAIGQKCSGAVRKRLYYSGLAEIELPVPDLRRQRAAVARIDKINETIRFIREDNSDRHELPQLKQAILQEAIEGKLTAAWRTAHPDTEPASALLRRIQAEKTRLIAAKKLRPEKTLPPIPDSEIPFEIPEGWTWCSLATVMILRDGERDPISKSDREKREKIYPYYGASGIIDQIDGYTHDGRFLLVGEDGSNLRLRSTPIAFEATGKIWVNNHAHVLEFSEPALQDFVSHRLNGMDLSEFVTGGFQPKLSQDSLNKIPIPLPPLAEQTEIVARVESLMAGCRALETEIAQARAHAAHLLQAVLREAFAPAANTAVSVTDSGASDCPAAATDPGRSASPEFSRTVLAAEIVDSLHAHETFGQVKLQKLLYLAEYHFQLSEIDSHPLRYAAGPHDPRLIRSVEQSLSEHEWFEEVPRPDGPGHAYRPLARAGAHRDAFTRLWPDKAPQIRAFLDELRSWKTERCERFATLYAAWNDLLIWRQDPTESAILEQVLEKWDPAKKRISRDLWLDSLRWMREHGYVPTGFGHPTQPAPQPELPLF